MRVHNRKIIVLNMYAGIVGQRRLPDQIKSLPRPLEVKGEGNTQQQQPRQHKKQSQLCAHDLLGLLSWPLNLKAGKGRGRNGAQFPNSKSNMLRKKERKGRRGLPSSSRSSMPQLPLGIWRKRSTTKDGLKFTISKTPFVALNDGAPNDTK